MEGLLTVEETHNHLEISRTTLYSYIDKGLLTPIKDNIGRRTYFNKEEVEKFKKNRPKRIRLKQKTLKEIRREKELTTKDLADHLEISEERYRNYETDAKAVLEMTASELVRFCEITNTNNFNLIKGL